jgi:NAD(P) transhydrogenase subunit alpha
MSSLPLAELTIFALAVFLGFELISKVPVVLHTPLMSGTNAIHGIVVIGGMLVLGTADTAVEVALGFVATLFGAMNFAGGFVVTDRMLEMFRKKPKDGA